MKKSDILKVIKEVLAEEKPGLWANIRAKRARGEKPAHKNSNAHKDAVKAGKKINAMKEGEDKTFKKGDELKIKLPNGKEFDLVFVDYSRTKGVGFGKFKDENGEYDVKPFDLSAVVSEVNEGEGKALEDLQMGEKFTFNGKEFTFIELYPELPNAARVVLPDGRKSVVSFGGGVVNTGKKAGIGPDAFGQGKGHHID